MQAHNERSRRGRIDDVPDLKTFDLVKFHGSNPYGNDFITGGFREGAAYFRNMIDTWKFVDRQAVADIGCGYGRWSMFLAEVNDSVVGFERNGAAIELCRKLTGYFGLDNATFTVADVSQGMPAEDASFDAAWCFNTMQFLHRGKAMREIHRILKPGGILHLGHYNGLGRILEKFFQGYKAGGLKHETTRFALQSLRGGPLFDGRGNYGSPQHMPQVLERFGFELLESPPMTVELKRTPSVPADLVEHLQDLTAFAERLEASDDLAARFAQFPELAYGSFVINVALCARKT